jgi:hypothetical protein
MRKFSEFFIEVAHHIKNYLYYVFNCSYRYVSKCIDALI